MFKVMVNVWTNSGDDYIEGEYTGIEYETIEEARRELIEARKTCNDCWIREV